MEFNSFPHKSTQHQEDEELVDEVVLWLVKMSSDDCTEADQQAFEHWQEKDPKRIALVKEYQKTLGHFYKLKQQNRSRPVLNILEKTFSQTQQSLWHLRSFFAVFCLGLLVLLLWNELPTQEWFADTKNEYNQWNQQYLSDHSQIKISGTTAYDVSFRQNQRLIQLYNGNILVHVAKDAMRPFVIKTKYARITALGTRFIVNQSHSSTVLTMLESKVRIEPLVQTKKGTQHNLIINAGQQIIIHDDGAISYSHISPELYEAAWQQKMLVVKNMPLPEVLSILQNYQSQKMTFNNQDLDDIKLSATLPLNDMAIDLLTHSVDIKEEKNFFGQQKISKREK